MAGASMKEIKTRIRSVQSTCQITKAMQLVAASKLRGARLRMEASHPYFVAAKKAVEDIAAHKAAENSVFLKAHENVNKCCYIVIAGDRGLAGSYNSNVFRALDAEDGRTEHVIVPIGRRSCDRFAADEERRAENISTEECDKIARFVLDGYVGGEFDEVRIVYTKFVNVLVQKTEILQLLPVEKKSEPIKTGEMVFEPGVDSVLAKFMPQYLSGMIYAAVCESYLSEQAARRVAMDSASKNAEEMIQDLLLRYNRARQSSITQEITEIVAGAEH